MKVLQIVRQCLSLLSRRSQWKLLLVTVAQMATGALDLAGVALLGLVGVLGAALATGQQTPQVVENLTLRFGLGDLSTESVVVLFFVLAGLALIVKSIISAILLRKTYRFLSLRQAELSAALASALFSQPLIEVQRRASQDVAFIITIATQAVMVGILGAASLAIADISLLVILGLGLTAIDPLVSIFALLFFGTLTWLLQKRLSGWAKYLGTASANIDIEAYQVIQEALAGYREISVSSRRPLYVERIRLLRKEAAVVNADSHFLMIIPKYVFEVALVVGALLLSISQFTTKGLVEAVAIVAVFLVAGARIMPAVMRLQMTALSIRQAEAPARKALELWNGLRLESSSIARTNLSPVSASTIVRREYPGFVPELEIDHVSLRYPGASEPAIRDVSLSVRPGSFVALVGQTGSGKSTLADLILGVARPDSGVVLLGGQEPSQVANQWPGAIAYVPQDVAVMNATVRENVAMGLPADSYEDEWIWEALERAELADFLKLGRDGLDTLVGERGATLSGGQRQRLGLARAFFSKPKFLVLDEATSALDVHTEMNITKSLNHVIGEATVVTIAHRLSTVREASNIVMLKDGKILDAGSFHELRSSCEEFRKLARLSRM